MALTTRGLPTQLSCEVGHAKRMATDILGASERRREEAKVARGDLRWARYFGAKLVGHREGYGKLGDLERALSAAHADHDLIHERARALLAVLARVEAERRREQAALALVTLVALSGRRAALAEAS